MSLQVQPLTADILANAYRIHQQAQPRPWSLTTFEDCTTAPYAGLVATVDGQVVGYAVLLFVADEGTLMDIAVDNAFHRQGIANALMDSSVLICEQKQVSSLWLEVRVNNPAAISLYEKYQFTHIETRKKYYDTPEGKVDAHIMMRNICPPSI